MILAFNIIFVIIASVIISHMSVTGTEGMGFFESAFSTITMILDPGCIEFVIKDGGQASVTLVIICIVVIITGMISFTGAIIGYLTNFISEFIANVNAGGRELAISDHVAILNWNTRASEIINDLLYCDSKQKVVVLVSERKAAIEKEIEERLDDTIRRENALVLAQCEGMPFWERVLFLREHRFKNNVTVVVREGDIFSSKQLNDISLKRARMVVILGNDESNAVCKYEKELRLENRSGNALTIKTLMQVADITGAFDSDDDQKVIVEINDDWTGEQVEKIIRFKKSEGKTSIVPLTVYSILGQLLSQFSLMPELNLVYQELFSNRGMTFYVTEYNAEKSDIEYIEEYLDGHLFAIPLTSMSYKGKDYFYYAACSRSDVHRGALVEGSEFTVKLNRDYWIEPKRVVILGHNSKTQEIMQGFISFCDEWQYPDSKKGSILQIIVIDDLLSLESMNFYRDYPFVIRTIAADSTDKEQIVSAIDAFRDMNDEDVSVLILSDDEVRSEDIDANALTNLVLNQDIISSKLEEDPDFDIESIDVVVEIIDPKHYDVVSNYSVDNVVISNRYISKMATQIGDKEELFSFFRDILTYDAEGVDSYISKEVYIKKVSQFFEEIPGRCRADELIRAVFKASVDSSLPEEKRYPTIVLGYVQPGGNMVLFGGNQRDIMVELGPKDKLIVFSNH